MYNYISKIKCEVHDMTINAHVLIVDDQSINLELLGTICRHIGFTEISKASSALEALRIQKTTPADIIFLDIYMPEVTGIEIIGEIKTITPQATIIMASSAPTAINVRESLELGADGFIAKPFSSDNIINALKQARRNKQRT